MKKKSARTTAEDPRQDHEDSEVVKARAEELSGDFEEELIELEKDVEKGFNSQRDRSDDIFDYWDAYNCVLNANQVYAGNSDIYVPIIYNAVNARKTRFVNQMFPQSGRYVEVTTENGDIPQPELALVEHYVRRARMRTQVMPALMRNGDVEGQYTVCVGWSEKTRRVVYREQKGDDNADDMVERKIRDGHPTVEVIADTDLLVLPATAESLDEALEQGGSVTIIRRWSKAKIKQMMADDEIMEEAGEALLEQMNKDSTKKDKAKEMVDSVGIKNDGRGKYALVYETWTKLAIENDEDETERLLCRAYFGRAGDEKVLSCKRNPYWCDKLPIFSAPVEKLQGSFKGMSKVRAAAQLQYQANDAVNEGMDSAAYALMPIVMTDPEKNPRTGSMILSLAAIWETSPADTQFAKFPPLWKDALEIVASCRTEIFQTLSVNPAQITSASPGRKPSKADIANEQQVDILTTADAVTVVEDEILTPVVSFMLELDHQFRDEHLMVKAYGAMGMQAVLQEIGPIQMDMAYQFRWFGVEAARNAQQVQQQIGAINVLRGIPPQMYAGYAVDLGPVISQLVENLFGPRLAPLTFKDKRKETTIPIEMENEVLQTGQLVPVHAEDDHQKHVQAQLPLAKQMGPQSVAHVHVMAHMQALQAMQKAQQEQMAQKPPGQPGTPGGAGPGVPGQPRQGAAPGAVRGGQQPPGAIHRDQMNDPRAMPQ